MSQNNSNSTTDPLPQLSAEERLSSLETAMAELLAGQRQILSELKVIQEDAKPRYVDLRERTDLNNDKLSVLQRELYQLVKDLRNPTFSVADTR